MGATGFGAAVGLAPDKLVLPVLQAIRLTLAKTAPDRPPVVSPRGIEGTLLGLLPLVGKIHAQAPARGFAGLARKPK